MNSNKCFPIFAALLLAISRACGQDKTVTSMQDRIKLVKELMPQQGTINLRNGLAKLTVPDGFDFYSPADTETVLVKLWGNPPSLTKPLGMLMPADKGPLDRGTWAVTIQYAEDGYVKDSDASKINYDDLLKTMQKAVQKASEGRQKKGYSSMELIGWAAPPRYDSATHKLYWAKELRFGNEPETTLNYNIRMLGRRGVLELNVIAAGDQLPAIEAQTPQILAMVNFNDGNRYSDFKPGADKVATYGIAALVAGGIAAKMGLFKILLGVLLAAKKLVVIGFVAVVAFVKRLVGGKKNTPRT